MKNKALHRRDLAIFSKAELIEIVLSQAKQIEDLQKRVNRLEKQLEKYKHPKNSNNSSLPPSKDENRPKRNQSLREKGVRKSGGQAGHKGSTLQMVSEPDEVIEHIPQCCNDCGKDLSKSEAVLTEQRQVVELPPITPLYIEHRSYSKKCSCGKVTKGKFPKEIKATIQYGRSIESTIAYYSARQYMSYERIAECLKEWMHLPISQGSVHNLLERFANKALIPYHWIKKRVQISDTVGADETGVKVNTDKHWFWTWQDKLNTFIAASDNRGYRTVEKHFKTGFPNAVLVSDCWSSHLKTPAKNHQLCMAHLFRDINYLIELTQSQWIKQLKQIFKDAIILKKKLKPPDYFDSPARQKIEKRLDRLLAIEVAAEHKEIKKFYKRISKYRQYIFPFLYAEQVPADNNGSERAIRNAKVKLKVSGQFRTPEGAQNFAVIRSVIDTCLKRKIPIFDAFNRIAMLTPE